MGKGWAKGLTAETDQRVPRGVEARRGKQRVRRKPLEECKWRFAGHTKLALTWSDEMAYIVGLTATDGCLSNEQLTRTGDIAYVTEFHDSRSYEWFRSVGLMPRKSLVLGEIDVPDVRLLALARGLLDGDGSIRIGKLASHVLLPLLYPREMPCLERKRAIWYAYAQRHAVGGALK